MSNDSWQAAIYTIMSAPFGVPYLDQCWSACNGIDGFGHYEDDKELLRARNKHDELLDLIGNPRLILYRRHARSPLMAKVWYNRTLDREDDHDLILATLARAVRVIPKGMGEIELYDWERNNPRGAKNLDERYELSIEIVGAYSGLRRISKVYVDFMNIFDKGAWQ